MGTVTVRFPVVRNVDGSSGLAGINNPQNKTARNTGTTMSYMSNNTSLISAAIRYYTNIITYSPPAGSTNLRITGYQWQADAGHVWSNSIAGSGNHQAGVRSGSGGSIGETTEYYWAENNTTQDVWSPTSLNAMHNVVGPAPSLGNEATIVILLQSRTKNTIAQNTKATTRVSTIWLDVIFAWDDAPADVGESHLAPLGSSVPHPVGSLYVGGVQVKKIVSADAAKTGVPVGTVLYRLPGVPP